MTPETITWPAAPYKGLGYYTEADEPLFAGRDQDIHNCATALAHWQTRLLLLHGSTGCGKSSFLRAGLIPRIEKSSAGISFARSRQDGTPLRLVRSTAEPLAKLADALHDLASCTVTRITPDGECTLDLRQALPDEGVLEAADFRLRYGDNPEAVLGILEKLSRLLPETLVLIVDQGEEVLTVDSSERGERWRSTFFSFLSDFVSAQFDVKLVLALRTEYVGRFSARVQRGMRGVTCAEYYLDDLDESQIAEAVLRPTDQKPIGELGSPNDYYRFSFEDGVVDKMIAQLRSSSGGRLTALQIACHALYERVRDHEEPRIIRAADLAEIGGVGGAVEGFLDQTLLDCGQAVNLAPVTCDEEAARWKLVLHGLASLQPNGTITTDIQSEDALRRELEGTRLNVDKTISTLLEVQLLREVNVVEPATGRLIRCFGLGHDTLGLVLHDWKSRYDRQVKTVSSATQAVRVDEPDSVRDDIGLCMSGGGYRAMLFNLGALWRLNELGYLPRLARISAVSGGAIVSAYLGAQWNKLEFGADGSATNFGLAIVNPIRGLASKTLDSSSILLSLLTKSAADLLAKQFQQHLFGDRTLQDLPDVPRIVVSATNLQSPSLFLFSKRYLADYTLGQISNPTIPLARAVAASAAMPPVLSPLILEFPDSAWNRDAAPGSQTDDRFRRNVYLADGAVYDHLGMEAAWAHHRTLLISDGGATARPDPAPPTDWVRQSARLIDVVDAQLRSLRLRQVAEAFGSGQKKGAYWSIRSDVGSLRLHEAFQNMTPADLALIPTRFLALDPRTQERLINWGYAACDEAVQQRWVPTPIVPGLPPRLPYPNAETDSSAVVAG